MPRKHKEAAVGPSPLPGRRAEEGECIRDSGSCGEPAGRGQAPPAWAASLRTPHACSQ